MNTVHFLVPAGVDDPLRPSGGNVFDRRLATALPGQGWKVREHRIPGAWPFPAAIDRAAVGRLVGALPDGATVLLDGLIGSVVPDVVMLQAFRLRLVILAHAPVSRGADHERVALRGVAAVIAPSESAGRTLRTVFGVRPTALFVTPPGTDPAAGATHSDSGGRLLCVGVLAPHKGQDVLVEALAGAGSIPWECSLVGSTELDPVFAAGVRTRIAAAGWQTRIRLRGPLTGDRLDAAYRGADLLVVASRRETYGMVIGEALARGVPVLAPHTGGIPEALGHTSAGRPGLLVRPRDRAALTAGLRTWLTDAAVRDTLRHAAAERRTTLSDWSATAQQVARVLATVSAVAA